MLHKDGYFHENVLTFTCNLLEFCYFLRVLILKSNLISAYALILKIMSNLSNLIFYLGAYRFSIIIVIFCRISNDFSRCALYVYLFKYFLSFKRDT